MATPEAAEGTGCFWFVVILIALVLFAYLVKVLFG